jgi:hypothetical protein
VEKAPERYDPHYDPRKPRNYFLMSNFVTLNKLTKEAEAFALNFSLIQVPNKVEEALGVPIWRKTMETEMEALQKNET